MVNFDEVLVSQVVASGLKLKGHHFSRVCRMISDKKFFMRKAILLRFL